MKVNSIKYKEALIIRLPRFSNPPPQNIDLTENMVFKMCLRMDRSLLCWAQGGSSKRSAFPSAVRHVDRGGQRGGTPKPVKARTSTGSCLGDFGSLGSLGFSSLPHPVEETSLWRGRSGFHVGLLWGCLDSPLGPGSPSSPVGPRYPGGPRAPG